MYFKHRGVIMGVNLNLAIGQRISFEDLEGIVKGHKLRYDLLQLLKNTEDETLMRIIFEQLRQNEFELQYLWGFPASEPYHRSFEWPHCKCPKWDNRDAYPFNQIISAECPLHGPDLLEPYTRKHIK